MHESSFGFCMDMLNRSGGFINLILRHKVNKNIKAHILSDEEMREIGFTDRNQKNWYFCRKVASDITFNVTIPKDGSDIEIVTLDEDWLQPYDFQYILERNPKLEYANKVKQATEDWMKYLINRGVLSGWECGDYI